MPWPFIKPIFSRHRFLSSIEMTERSTSNPELFISDAVIQFSSTELSETFAEKETSSTGTIEFPSSPLGFISCA